MELQCAKKKKKGLREKLETPDDYHLTTDKPSEGHFLSACAENPTSKVQQTPYASNNIV